MWGQDTGRQSEATAVWFKLGYFQSETSFFFVSLQRMPLLYHENVLSKATAIKHCLDKTNNSDRRNLPLAEFYVLLKKK